MCCHAAEQDPAANGRVWLCGACRKFSAEALSTRNRLRLSHAATHMFPLSQHRKSGCEAEEWAGESGASPPGLGHAASRSSTSARCLVWLPRDSCSPLCSSWASAPSPLPPPPSPLPLTLALKSRDVGHLPSRAGDKFARFLGSPQTGLPVAVSQGLPGSGIWPSLSPVQGVPAACATAVTGAC